MIDYYLGEIYFHFHQGLGNLLPNMHACVLASSWPHGLMAAGRLVACVRAGYGCVGKHLGGNVKDSRLHRMDVCNNSH